jgi:hypothetical protein
MGLLTVCRSLNFSANLGQNSFLARQRQAVQRLRNIMRGLDPLPTSHHISSY